VANLYIISGCNGAGKTTASYSVLPDMLNCREFVNADEIARGLSPFQQDKMAIQAGKIMLNRIQDLINQGVDFAFETTLATKSYVQLIRTAQDKGYQVTLLFFWLNSPKLAIERVEARVLSGGHNIPTDVILRRYDRGIENFSKLYAPICDFWMLIDNSEPPFQIIAEGFKTTKILISNEFIYRQIVKT
jgi:predicted ABC-type ATPase